MRIRQRLAVVFAAVLVTGASVAAAEADGSAAAAERETLVKTRSSRFDALYLLPGSDLRAYTKVMLDPARVAFAEGWRKDVNQTPDLMRRTTIEDAEQIVEQAAAGLGRIFADAFKNAGYEVVTTPGAEVLRLSPQIVDFSISAPENLTTSPRTRVYAASAGEATLVLQFHDSTTGVLLGRAVDRRTAGDRGSFGSRVRMRLRDSISTVSNRSDFEALFALWAGLSIKSLEELKARSPLVRVATEPEP